jgi:hypothetical protein
MFSLKSIVSTIAIASVAALGVQAETHVVHFTNRCGFGTVRSSPSLVSFQER